MTQSAAGAPQRPPAVEAIGVEKRFGRVVALAGVDLKLAEGEAYTLLGPNGAGKTTLVRILSTLTRASAGRVAIGGLDLRECTADVRRLIGVVLHQTMLYRDLSAEENLLLYARLYDLPDARTRVREALEAVGLGLRAADPVRTLSRGMQQRVSIARATLHEPRILLFDEPFGGLDEHGARRLNQVLERQVAVGRTVLVTTHDAGHGTWLCHRLGILSGGRVALELSARGLTARSLRRQYLEVVGGGGT
ncbi:MAG: ABC transporter ATP-binding protein [Anaerolineae bacterium]|nr:ABC transporter ATP-binding protein [Anaerolineae bacterium]